jgi:hypothetical protein
MKSLLFIENSTMDPKVELGLGNIEVDPQAAVSSCNS